MQSSEQMVQPMGAGRIEGRCRSPGYKGTGKEIAEVGEGRTKHTPVTSQLRLREVHG